MKYDENLVNFEAVISLADLALTQGQDGLDVILGMMDDDSLDPQVNMIANQAYLLLDARNGESND